MKIRDSQRSKLYAAENDIFRDRDVALKSVSDITTYIQEVSSRAPLKKRYGHAIDLVSWPVEIRDGRRHRIATAYGVTHIAMPRWARKDWIVLHELAHIIHARLSFPGMGLRSRAGSRTRELRGGAGHGWQYAAIYLDLVHFCLGKETHDKLKAAFKERKVRFKPKSTRIATPEMIERLAQARLKRAKNLADLDEPTTKLGFEV